MVAFIRACSRSGVTVWRNAISSGLLTPSPTPTRNCPAPATHRSGASAISTTPAVSIRYARPAGGLPAGSRGAAGMMAR